MRVSWSCTLPACHQELVADRAVGGLNSSAADADAGRPERSAR